MNTPKQQNLKPFLSSMSAHAEDKTLKDKQYGAYRDERCPNCGKFASREDCFYDRKDRDNDGSDVLRFCNIECADEWHDQPTKGLSAM